jgi:hypothetical protein
MLHGIDIFGKAPDEPQVVVTVQTTQGFGMGISGLKADGATQFADDATLAWYAKLRGEGGMKKCYRFYLHGHKDTNLFAF